MTAADPRKRRYGSTGRPHRSAKSRNDVPAAAQAEPPRVWDRCPAPRAASVRRGILISEQPGRRGVGLRFAQPLALIDQGELFLFLLRRLQQLCRSVAIASRKTRACS